MATPIPVANPGIVGGVAATNRVRDTANILTAGQVPIQQYDISDTIYTKNRMASPFTVLLESIGKKYGWGDTHYWSTSGRLAA